MKTMKKLGFMALLVLAMTGLCACGKKKADLKDYVSIEVSGTDGYGSLTATIDYQKLGEALGVDEEMKDLENAENLSDVKETLAKGDAVYKLQCSADKTEGLKNSDKVKITFEDYQTVEETLKAAFSNTEFSYTVKDLDPVKEIDPFEGVTVSFDSGYFRSTADVNSPKEYNNLIKYTATMPEILDADSVATVTYEYDEEELGRAGYVVKADAPASKDFPVEGIDTYVSSYEGIGEDALAKMKEKSISRIKQEYSGTYGSYIPIQILLEEDKNIDYAGEDPNGKLASDIKYEGGYFKSSSSGNEASQMFSFQVKDRKTKETVYVVVNYRDIIHKASGDIYVDYDSAEVTYLKLSVEDIENELVTNNEFVKAE